MQVIFNEMPDKSVQRTVAFDGILNWLQAGRAQADIDIFVHTQVAMGVPYEDAIRLVSLMNNPEREIANRGSTELSRAWAYGLRDGNLSKTVALDLIARISCPDAVRYVVMEHTLAKNHAEYRAALRLNGDALYWDMPEARTIHRGKLRKMRAGMFATLDAEYMMADETGDYIKKAAIAAKKQVLRDITAHPGIEDASTIDELISVGVMLMEVQP